MKQLLDDIQRRLAAATLPDGSPLFAHVDVDWGQVDFCEGPPPVKFPCALIDLQSAEFSNLGQRAQVGRVAVQIRVVDMILGRTSAGAPEAQREKAARVFDLLREAHRLLHGWTGTPALYGRLSRKAVARARRRDGLHEYTLTFEAAVTDSSAQPQYVLANLTPVVTA
ncbi:MAG: hypothetical protein LBL94_10050 [Prevotellaceae bacterium]|jgi:hypothetical protein|nr:hypothetical protein [Prevotellaceae bacterium]